MAICRVRESLAIAATTNLPSVSKFVDNVGVGSGTVAFCASWTTIGIFADTDLNVVVVISYSVSAISANATVVVVLATLRAIYCHPCSSTLCGDRIPDPLYFRI